MGLPNKAAIAALLLASYSQYCLAQEVNACQDLGPVFLEDCSGVCEAAGDPHFDTFDCVRYEYHGTCDFTLVKNCGGEIGDFEIIGEFQRLATITTRSVIRKLRIEIGGMVIELNKHFDVTIDGVPMSALSLATSSFSIQRYCNAVVVTLDVGITIYWTSPFRALIVIAPERKDALAGNLCGLCGNYNDLKFDDFTTRENELVYDVVEFGDSWRTAADCELCDDCDADTCPINPKNKADAYEECEHMAQNFIFPMCGQVEADAFFQQCVYFLCAIYPEYNGLCLLLTDTVNSCGANNMPAEYLDFLNTFCEGDNRITTPNPTTLTPKESTTTEEIDRKCVLNGASIEIGESILIDDCVERCTCQEDLTLTCAQVCDDGEVCEERNWVRDCYCERGNFISAQGVCREMFTCRACGDPHYVSFDGVRYDYQGSCSYILAEAQPEAPNYFLVVADNIRSTRNPRVSITGAVWISVFGWRICISRESRYMLIDDNGDIRRARFPLLNNQIRVFRSGIYTVVITDFGLRVRWDGRSCVYISVPDTFVNNVLGLCGKLSGNSIDDFTTPQGEIETDINTFGNSWGVGDCEPCTAETCTGTDPCEENPENEAIAMGTCSLLFNVIPDVDDTGYFATCLNSGLVNSEDLFTECKYDLCADPGDDAIVCSYFKDFVERCRDVGFLYTTWRTDILNRRCEIDCGDSMTYHDCGAPNPATCANPTPADLNLPCVQGCQCNEGLILSGDECVLPSECGCLTDEGRYYKIGDTAVNADCTEVCTCEIGGTMNCENTQGCIDGNTCEIRDGVRGCYCQRGNILSNGVCQSTFTCRACGDPHYTTYDGTRYDYQGKCYYVLSQSREGAPNEFLVIGDNIDSPRRSTVAITRFVFIFVYDLVVRFSWNTAEVIVNDINVDANDISVNLPYRWNNGQVRIWGPGRSKFLATDFGLRIRWNGDSCVFISIPSTFMNQVEGLCGHLSGDRDDDFTNPDGEIETDINQFGDSWQVGDTCELCTPETCVTGNPCEADPEAAAIAQQYCSVLTDRNGPFAGGQNVFDPADLAADCMFDLCANPIEVNQACEYLEAFAEELCDSNVNINGWRDRVLDGLCAIQCDESMTYDDCGLANPPSCADPSPADDNLPPVPGCQCKPGLVQSGDTCVPLEQCGCVSDDGKYYQNGESFLNADCSIRCSCASGTITCADTSCDVNAECTVEDNVRACVCNEGFEGDGMICTAKNGPCDQEVNPCQNGGICVSSADNADGFICQCTEGWAGPRCAGGQIVCEASGDPHYLNFDGDKFDFQGNCKYTLAKNCNDGILEFSVVVNNEEMPRNPRVSLTQSVTVNVFGDVIFFGQTRRDKNNKIHFVKINDVEVNGVDKIDKPSYEIDLTGPFMKMQTKDGNVIVEYNGKSTVKVTVPASFGGSLCGLCGNGNGQQDDDRATPEGVQESDINVWGHSWAVNQDTCDRCDDCPTTDACEGADPGLVRKAQEQCDVITATVGYLPRNREPANILELEELVNNGRPGRGRGRGNKGNKGNGPGGPGLRRKKRQAGRPGNNGNGPPGNNGNGPGRPGNNGNGRPGNNGNGPGRGGRGGGPFDKCHLKVDPQPFFKDCRFDWCANDGPDTLCEIIADYALACQLQGIEIMDWRALLKRHECNFECPMHSTYNLCAPACQARCDNPIAAEACIELCKEGCVCDEGYLWKNEECVLVADCFLGPD